MALSAHVGFVLPSNKDIGAHVVSHYSRLGYRLINQDTREWGFERGNRLATLWRFDIRACQTHLTVRAAPQQDGGTWVSCNWLVYTFMRITTGADVATLEVEGRHLESVLRGMA